MLFSPLLWTPMRRAAALSMLFVGALAAGAAQAQNAPAAAPVTEPTHAGRSQLRAPTLEDIKVEVPRQVKAATAALGYGRQRLALVIGNGTVGSRLVVDPAPRDVAAVAKTLGAGGYIVMRREDTSALELRAALKEFRARLQPGAIGFIYVTGLGAQIDGQNLLVTREAQIDKDTPAAAVAARVQAGSVPLSEVIEALQGTPDSPRFLVVDAAYAHPALARLPKPGLSEPRLPAGMMALFGHGLGVVQEVPAVAPLPDPMPADARQTTGSRFASVLIDALAKQRVSGPVALRNARKVMSDNALDRPQPWIGGDSDEKEEFAELTILDAILPRTPEEMARDAARQLASRITRDNKAGERSVSEVLDKPSPGTNTTAPGGQPDGVRRASGAARNLAAEAGQNTLASAVSSALSPAAGVAGSVATAAAGAAAVGAVAQAVSGGAAAAATAATAATTVATAAATTAATAVAGTAVGAATSVASTAAGAVSTAVAGSGQAVALAARAPSALSSVLGSGTSTLAGTGGSALGSATSGASTAANAARIATAPAVAPAAQALAPALTQAAAPAVTQGATQAVSQVATQSATQAAANAAVRAPVPTPAQTTPPPAATPVVPTEATTAQPAAPAAPAAPVQAAEPPAASLPAQAPPPPATSAPVADPRTLKAGMGERPFYVPRKNSYGYSEGDTFSYQVVDTWRDELKDRFTHAIEEVLEDGRMHANNQSITFDPQGRVKTIRRRDGSGSEFTPYEGTWWNNAQRGERRRIEYSESVRGSGGAAEVEWSGTAKVGRLRKIETPAGEFEALPIESDGWFTRIPARGGERYQGKFERTVWYSPKLGHPVLIEFQEFDRLGKLMRKERIELVHAQSSRLSAP